MTIKILKCNDTIIMMTIAALYRSIYIPLVSSLGVLAVLLYTSKFCIPLIRVLLLPICHGLPSNII